MATKNNRHRKKPPLKTGPRANRRIDGKSRSKFSFYSRLSDGKHHPVVVKRIEDQE